MLLLATAAVVYTITKGCSKEGRKKSRVERDRERRREGGREGGKLAEVIVQLSQSRGHCCMSHAEWFIASVSVLTGNSHTRGHTHAHTHTHTHAHTHTHTHTRTRTHTQHTQHTAYLVMVQHAAPARTERNWINGVLCAKYRKLSKRTWLRYSFFTVIFVDVNVEAQLAACACLFACFSVANQSMWHCIWQKQ